MRHWLILAATTAAITSFAPSASQAQVTVDTPVGGVHIGDRPYYRDYDGPVVRERRVYREREVGCAVIAAPSRSSAMTAR